MACTYKGYISLSMYVCLCVLDSNQGLLEQLFRLDGQLTHNIYS